MLSPHPAAAEGGAGNAPLPPPLRGGARMPDRGCPPTRGPEENVLRKGAQRRGRGPCAPERVGASDGGEVLTGGHCA